MQIYTIMELQEIVDYIKLHPASLEQGAGFLSKRLKTTPEKIKEAKRIVRNTNPNKTSLPKILILDLETAPMKAYVWRRWKENISLEQTISEWFMLAWSAKWLYSPDIYGEVLTPEEVRNEDDSRIAMSLYALINKADIVVAHNGKHADVPWMNSRFILNNLQPPKPFTLIDTLEIARKQFGFSSNKLDALAGYFNIPHKLHTDFTLWKECMEGKQQSLDYMLEYNKMDVKILEEVYIKLMPWIKGGPNMNVYLNSDIPVCANCGSEAIEIIPNQYYYTSVGKYILYRCKDCGAISRGRFSVASKKVTKAVSVGK